MESAIIQILTEAGSLGIAIGLLLYMWRRDKMYNKTMNNHLEHTIGSQEKIADSNIELAKALQSLKGVINNKFKRGD